MPKYNNSKSTTIVISIFFVLFITVDIFIIRNYENAENPLVGIMLFGILTILFWYGIVYNIIKESKFKKARRLKDKWMVQTVKAKIIRFNMDHFFGPENKAKKYYSFTVSDWKNQFTSEPFNWTVFWYDPMKLANLHTIWINYNILNIGESIDELEQIKTPDDIKRYIENNSYLLWSSFNILHSMARWWLYESLLYKINECKEYLKEVSKNPDFKKSYFQHKHHQINIWDNITVYIDPNDPTVYQIDTDFLYY